MSGVPPVRRTHVRKGFIWAGRQETKRLAGGTSDAFLLRMCSHPKEFSQSHCPGTTSGQVCGTRQDRISPTIAVELGLSEHTVKNYLFRAFEKLGVSSRIELLFYLTVGGHTFSATREDDVEVDL